MAPGKKGKNNVAKKEAKKQKAEVKESKKANKAGKAIYGDDDIDSLLAEFAEVDKKKTTVTIAVCDVPSPRVNATFTAHPTKDELILFGGEHYNGRRVVTFADLFVYNVSRSEWRAISIPSTPPPRTSHQAIVVPTANGAQMYVFGGDFTSPSQLFRHYNDLWVLDLNSYKWEQIKAPNGPSPRSGHRMIYFKRKLYVFGGFYDNHADIKYFDDMYVFDLDTQEWSSIKPANKSIPWPTARSGFGFITHEGSASAVMCGGYSTQLKKKGQLDEKSNVHCDMWSFDFTKHSWTPLKNGGDSLPSRSGVSLYTVKNKVFAFGGVLDVEMDGDDDDMHSTFYNDMRAYYLKKRAWELIDISAGRDPTVKKAKVDDVIEVDHKKSNDAKEDVPVKNSASWKWDGGEKEKEKTKSKGTKDNDDDDDDEKILSLLAGLEVDDDDEDEDDASLANIKKRTGYIWPRRNAMICVRNSIVYLFGGVFERGSCEVTLNDLHYCDTRRGKLNTWYTLIDADMSKQEWFQEDDDDDDEDDDDDDEDDEEEEVKSKKNKHRRQVDEEEEEEEQEEDEDRDPLDAIAGETLQVYFARTKDHWMSEAQEEGLSEKLLRKNAFDMAKMKYAISSDE